MIAEARQVLLAGPAASESRRRNLQAVITERLPRAVELLQRQPMGAAAAERCARTLAAVQDFVDTCLRSPLLGEGNSSNNNNNSNFLDLSPLLHVLRLLVSADAVPPKFLSAADADAGAAGSHCFNRDHGKPLLREWRGCSRRIWPGERTAR